MATMQSVGVRLIEAVAAHDDALAEVRAELDRLHPGGAGPEPAEARLRGRHKAFGDLRPDELVLAVAELIDGHAAALAAVRDRLRAV